MKIDNVTFWMWFGVWPLWLIWELVLIVLDRNGVKVDLISQEARERAYQLNVIPFVWGAMASHWWLNWARPYVVAYPAVIFWGLVGSTFVLDVVMWNTTYNTLSGWFRVFRWPGTQMLLGLVLGLVLFPQRDIYRP